MTTLPTWCTLLQCRLEILHAFRPMPTSVLEFWMHECTAGKAALEGLMQFKRRGAHLLWARIMPQRNTETGTPNSLFSCCSCTSVAHLLHPYLQRQSCNHP